MDLHVELLQNQGALGKEGLGEEHPSNEPEGAKEGSAAEQAGGGSQPVYLLWQVAFSFGRADREPGVEGRGRTIPPERF